LISSESGNLKLADFGIAKAAEQTRITQVGSVLGTAAYLSPEQARGEEAGPASDIYSLGVCAYQLLAGRLPHEYGSLTELALKQQNDQVRPITDFRPEVPPALDRAIRVCLEPDPSARYGSALDLGDAMQAGLEGHVTQATVLLEDRAQATRAVGPETAATRAMGRTEAAPPPPPARRREPAPRRRSGIGWLLAALAVVAAGVVVAIAVIQGTDSSGSGDLPTIDAQQFEEQLEGLRNLIEENTE
jgi:hypothetical protein